MDGDTAQPRGGVAVTKASKEGRGLVAIHVSLDHDRPVMMLDRHEMPMMLFDDDGVFGMRRRRIRNDHGDRRQRSNRKNQFLHRCLLWAATRPHVPPNNAGWFQAGRCARHLSTATRRAVGTLLPA